MKNIKTLERYSIIAALAIFLVVIARLAFSGESITVSTVPFGLPSGTKISVKEKAEFPSMPATAEAELRRANDLRMAGAFSAAQDYYETILLKYPYLPEALFGAAYSILAADSVSPEKIAKAKNLIENLSQKMPGSVWVQLLLTFSREHGGSLNNALDMAAELAAASPAFSEARLRYADLLLKTGQPAKAETEARAAISISEGSDARAYVNLAFALHKAGNLEECSELVNYALPRFQSQTELLLLHGYLSEYARDFDRAQNDYKRILALKPEDVNALNAIATLGEKIPPVTGVSAVSAGNVSLRDQAMETAKIILPLIEEYPENLPLREAIGRIYLKARLMKEARAQFSEIYAQDFEYPNIRRLLEEASDEQPKFIAPPPITNNKNLTDSLARTFASLRNSKKLPYDELGRYLAHYEATFKEFFSKYSITRFKKIDENTFSENYYIGSMFYDNTIFFDSKNQFYAMRSVITGSTDVNAPDYINDLFGHFLKKESEILGEGSVLNNSECGGEKWNGVAWVSRDNFEIFMQGSKTPRTVFILRLHAKRFSDTGNICSYVNMALGKNRAPR